jgi:hypothetical protein
MKKNWFIWFMLIMTILVMGLSFWKLNYNERKRTKDYKTVEEWAVEIAKEDFFYIRESGEVYLYTIEEFHLGNYEDDDYGKYFRAFKVEMMDDGGDSEIYLVVIKYNIDNHFMANFKRFFGATKEERFGEEHIVWADCDEI